MLQFWQLVLTALTPATSSTGVVLTWRSNAGSTDQEERQARREERWRRLTWAIGLLSADHELHREAGLRVIAQLGRSSLIGTDEKAVLEEVFDAVCSQSEFGEAAVEDSRLGATRGAGHGF